MKRSFSIRMPASVRRFVAQICGIQAHDLPSSAPSKEAALDRPPRVVQLHARGNGNGNGHGHGHGCHGMRPMLPKAQAFQRPRWQPYGHENPPPSLPVALDRLVAIGRAVRKSPCRDEAERAIGAADRFVYQLIADVDGKEEKQEERSVRLLVLQWNFLLHWIGGRLRGISSAPVFENGVTPKVEGLATFYWDMRHDGNLPALPENLADTRVAVDVAALERALLAAAAAFPGVPLNHLWAVLKVMANGPGRLSRAELAA